MTASDLGSVAVQNDDETKPAANEGTLQRLICEIRYSHGWKYLDVCGSLVHEVEALLGGGAEFTLPSVDNSEFRIHAERVLVSYGPESLSVSQEAPKSTARVIDLVERLWGTLSPHINVQQKVRRLGFRFFYVWSAESVSEARDRFARAQLVVPTPAWSEIIPESVASQLVCERTLPDGQTLRASIGSAELDEKVVAKLPEKLKGVFPRYYVQLDLDFGFSGNGRLNKLENLEKRLSKVSKEASDLAKLFSSRMGR